MTMYHGPSMEITTRIGCQINCLNCPQEKLLQRYHSENNSRCAVLSFEVYKKILEKIPHNVRIIFSGMSEPWLNPECTDMVLYTYEKGYPISIFTTATGMSRDDFDRIKHIPFEQFQLHLPDREGHCNISVDSKHIELVKYIVHELDTRNDIPVKGFSCHGTMLPELQEEGFGVNFQLHQEMFDRAGNLPPENRLHKTHTGHVFCYASLQNMNQNVLLPDGTVLLCCMDYSMEWTLGNLITDSYSSLFNSQAAREIREKMNTTGADMLCKRCHQALECKYNGIGEALIEIEELHQEITSQHGWISQLLESERSHLNQLNALNSQLEESKEKTSQLNVKLKTLQDVEARKDEALAKKDAGILKLQENFFKLEELIADKDRALIEREAGIARLKERVADRENIIAEKNKALMASEAGMLSLEEKLTDQDRLIADKDKTITVYNAEILELRQTVINKEGHIAQLLEPERELERIKSSRSWRFMGYVWKIRDVLVPRGSRRRLFGKALIKLIKHPVRFLSKFTPKRIGKFFRYLRTEGVEGVSRRMDDCLVVTDIRAQAIELVPVDSSEKKTAADYTAFSVPQWERPAVSIVIPVYNEFDYTYHCIYSVVENSGEVSYEIIVADDCSTDLTKEIQQIISGLVVVRNQENLRFLRNCNHAARQARGQYILFLNNDTQVQPNWLAPLVELIERDPRIGLVGSKLVYPDGRLQEAGGILWRDGSAWNYGNRSDPALPEYNYVKEADYISGASIMIRRALWEEIGGFDERFAPAYCEDSDLAFTVRKLGYKVMYQPLSVVVHFEGISNGTDTSSGQKAYQVANQKKLIQKWCEVLEQEHFENSKEVFRARDRSAGKKTLLMVDHYVPMYDKDAGSRTVFQYLKLFTDHGYHVKFIGDNFCAHEPYTQTLQQMGVEVLYGPYYAKHWSDWLAENGTHIDYVFLNRPHISVKYIDKVRQKTSAKIIYYGHDLHFLREQREYELTGDSSLLKSAEEWKQKELTLMQKADVSYYPSYVEVQEIQRLDASLLVRAIPAYLFDKAEPVTFDVTRRRGMMFIGGFAHRPNVDAVKWLAQEIMPELRRRLPGVAVHILGSNPPEEVTALAGEDFHIEGFVTDEQLTEFYYSCRIAIVPLRYGAGIKGKVVEAMRCGVPVVTTSVGAEGIAGAENILRIADSPSEFAQAAAELYRDNKALAKMSKTEQLYVRDHFSPENAVAIIGSDFDMEA